MMNNVNLTRGNLVILITYKLIMLTVLQSRKIGSAYAFVYFLVSTWNFKATKYLNRRRSYFPDWPVYLGCKYFRTSCHGCGILLFLLSCKFLYLSMINNVNPARGNLVIVTTYKLILLTVLQSKKLGSAYAFVYFLVSTGNFKATKYLNCRRSYFPDWPVYLHCKYLRKSCHCCGILLFLLSCKFLYLSMMNNVILTRRNLVIVTTYKLILVTVLQSRKIGSAYAFFYFLVSTGIFKATK